MEEEEEPSENPLLGFAQRFQLKDMKPTGASCSPCCDYLCASCRSHGFGVLGGAEEARKSAGCFPRSFTLSLSYSELIKTCFQASDFNQGEWDLWAEEVHMELKERTRPPKVKHLTDHCLTNLVFA